MSDLSLSWVVGILVGSLMATWLGVELFRQWSVKREFLDVPNERSSHSSPTPRGGGLVIVLTCLIGYVLIWLVFDVPFSAGYFAGAALVATVSWIDDLVSLAFWKRLLAHFVAAGFLVADVGVWNEVAIPLSSSTLTLGPVIGAIVTVGWVVWLLNLYNFMDGIDGIAGTQALVAGAGWAAVAMILKQPGLLLFSAVFSAASLGFLIHNWPPAKIFMGDVGSAFLGFTLAALPLLAQPKAGAWQAVLPLIGVAFVWLFFFDTVFTLVRRIIKGERFWEAHRGHIYQRMVIDGLSHRFVTVFYGTAAAILSALTVLFVQFGGIMVPLTISFLVLIAASQTYAAFRKTR